jgi:hypothetical protein
VAGNTFLLSIREWRRGGGAGVCFFRAVYGEAEGGANGGVGGSGSGTLPAASLSNIDSVSSSMFRSEGAGGSGLFTSEGGDLSFGEELSPGVNAERPF